MLLVFIVEMLSDVKCICITFNICGKSFRLLGSLYDHKPVHEEKKYDCREKWCRQMYTTRQSHYRHLRQNHITAGTSSRTGLREEPKLYYCNEKEQGTGRKSSTSRERKEKGEEPASTKRPSAWWYPFWRLSWRTLYSRYMIMAAYLIRFKQQQ